MVQIDHFPSPGGALPCRWFLKILVAAGLCASVGAAAARAAGTTPPVRNPPVMDDDPDQKPEVWVSFIWDYPPLGMNQAKLRDFDRDKYEPIAKKFYEIFKDKNDWTGSGTNMVVNEKALSTHWSHRLGKEDDFVDQADLALFLGHGTIFRFERSTFYEWNLFNNTIAAGDVNSKPGQEGGIGQWGDKDLEWIISIACYSLNPDAEWQIAFGGLHLILGYQEIVAGLGHPLPYGEKMGEKLADAMTGKKPLTVWQAWSEVNAIYTKTNSHRPAGIGKTEAMFKDYVWGKGDGPQPDPPPFKYGTDEKFVTWRVKPPGERSDQPADPPVSSLPRFGTIIRHGASGQEIRIPARLLAGDEVRKIMPVQTVVPPVVDEGYVRGVAARLCGSLGVLCQPDSVVHDEYHQWWAIQGNQVLIVQDSTGAFAYLDIGRWMVPPDTRPTSVPSPSEAAAIAESFLHRAGWFPADGRIDERDIVQDQIEFSRMPDSVAVTDSVWITSDEVAVRRYVNSSHGELPVDGSSGSMIAYVGDGGRIEAFFQNGWNPASAGENVPLLQTRTVVDSLLGDALPDCGCDLAQVDSVEVGYYASDPGHVQTSLEPCYIFDTTCRGAGLQNRVRIAIPAADHVITRQQPEAAVNRADQAGRLAMEARPNPGSRGTVLRVRLPRGGDLEIELTDAAGRRVLDRRWTGQGAGWVSLPLGSISGSATRLPPGVYFARARAGGEVSTRKLVVVE